MSKFPREKDDIATERFQKELGSTKILICTNSKLLNAIWLSSAWRGDPLGACTKESECREIALSQKPDLVVATQLLEEGNGINLIQSIEAKAPEIRTILFLHSKTLALYRQAAQSHADGIVLEPNIGDGHILTALEIVSRGGYFIEPEIAKALKGGRLIGNQDALTPREIAIMQLVVCGLTDKEIAYRMSYSLDAIKANLKAIYQKLNAHTRTRAAVALLLMGLIDGPKPLLPEN